MQSEFTTQTRNRFRGLKQDHLLLTNVAEALKDAR